MKTLIFIMLLAASCLAIHNKITFTSSDFIIGTWYSNGTTPENLTDIGCCAPLGHVNFSKDPDNSSQVFLTATQWNGIVCDSFNINTSYTMKVPFPHNASYMQLKDYSNNFSGINATFNVDSLDCLNNFSNGTQEVKFSFGLDYLDTDGVDGTYCSVILSKFDSIIQVSSVILIFFMVLFCE